jgi:hypothetical protein
VVTLDHPGTGAENAARWAAHDGALTKKAITVGFDEIGKLLPRALTLTPDDLDRMEKGEKKSIGPYGGKTVEDGRDGTLLFNGGLTHVQTISE